MDNLKDWKGVALLCDGYSGYDWLKEINGRILCRCVVHARRPMERALKENPNLVKIGILFYQNINLIEGMIKEKKLQGEEKAQSGKTMPSRYGRTSSYGLQVQSRMCQKTPISIRR